MESFTLTDFYIVSTIITALFIMHDSKSINTMIQNKANADNSGTYPLRVVRALVSLVATIIIFIPGVNTVYSIHGLYCILKKMKSA